MSNQNILIIMIDQLNGTRFPDGAAKWLHASNLMKLAKTSLRFEHYYPWDYQPLKKASECFMRNRMDLSIIGVD